MTFPWLTFLGLLPKSVEGRVIRNVVEVRHASFAMPEFVALIRAHEVAAVVAGDSDHPVIADPTASFVYARIMGTRTDEAAGYAPAELDAWASRAAAWAGGAAAEGVARDVFLYVIGGAKERNPAAAMALLDRLG